MESHTGTDTKEIDDVVASGSSGCVDRLLDVVNMSSIDFLPWAESVIDQVCFTSDTGLRSLSYEISHFSKMQKNTSGNIYNLTFILTKSELEYTKKIMALYITCHDVIFSCHSSAMYKCSFML